jgi:hypothetical protein
LKHESEEATGIPDAAIDHFPGSMVQTSGGYCAAKIFSWASHRQTTRAEDRAYSLMGPFGVHLSFLYGEGGNAFMRLQIEIMSRCGDDSIFAWDTGDGTSDLGRLARSLESFRNAGSMIPSVWDL